MSRGLFFYNDCEEQKSHQNEPDHILESCYLCSRPLTSDSDIFMYRGNTPFCSEDCRQEQIEFDEAREQKTKKMVSMRTKSADSDQSKGSSSDVQQASSIQVA